MNPIQYLQQVREELERVSWPTRKETVEMSLIVLAVSIGVGLYIGGLDALFTSMIDWVLTR